MQCRKVAVLAVVTDCEERNKQALLEIEKMSENNTMPPKLLLLTPLPDVVRIGKSLKCSWSNWFIDLNGQIYIAERGNACIRFEDSMKRLG